MNNLEEQLYVGNIMQRTWHEISSNGVKAKGEIKCNLIEENAILYKKKNGGYVYLENLRKKSDYKKVDKVEILDCYQPSKNNIVVMPAVALSEASNPTETWGSDGTLGLFIDSDTLKSYNSLKNNEDVTSKNTRL